jgi:drug/metabolite transporter (DMT)-like permease
LCRVAFPTRVAGSAGRLEATLTLRQNRASTTASGVRYAIVAALLFGASTPLAKALLGTTNPLLLAGLLYCGSGAGLATVLVARALLRPDRRAIDWPARSELGWLAIAIALGGIAAPPLLMYGLSRTPAATASLLLNLESVLTALFAWYLFRENFDRRIALGMAAIVAGGIVLAWTPDAPISITGGALLIAGACACWALDNNFTRKVSERDPLAIAALKGIVAGTVNLGLALYLGAELTDAHTAVAALALGFAAYGVSLTLFVLALRHLGTARAGAYYAIAPFFGALYAIVVQHEPATLSVAVAGALMLFGVWLHVSERHRHRHQHAAQRHAHAHRHDEHHRHAHDFEWDGSEPHVHDHEHAPIEHSHVHVPDVHHRHRH